MRPEIFPNSQRIGFGDPAPAWFERRVAEYYSPAEAFARTRCTWYDLVARCTIGPPDAELLGRVSGDSSLDELAELLGPDVVAPWRSVGLGPDALQLRLDHVALFKAPGPRFLTPNESVWADKFDVEGNRRPKPLLMGPSTIDARNRYRRFGLEISRAVGELPDFLGLELEFMTQLCSLEQRAWSHERGSDAWFLLDQQRSWIDDHLGRWVAPVCQAMEEGADTDFYRGLARVLRAFVQSDREALGTLLEPH